MTAATVKKEPPKVRNIINPATLKSDVEINPVDLDNAMLRQAPLYVHYATLSAQAAKQVDDRKMVLEVTEARFDRDVRNRVAEEGGKITEKAITNEIRLSPAFIGATRDLNKAKEIASIAKEALEAMKQRRDMVIQFGVARREEMKGEARVTTGDSQSARDTVLNGLKQNQ